MTQARYQSSLRLMLTPMVQPETVPRLGGAPPGVLTESTRGEGTDLVAYPGETSEMLMQLRNQGREILFIDVQVKGNFPPQWCRWNVEGRQLNPGQEMLVGIYFDVPADYLEGLHAPTGGAAGLDFSSTITVQYQNGGGRSVQTETLDFRLFVRPRSLYLNFLPQFYREVDFIGRLLKVFEQAFEPSVHALNAMWAYLDPLTAPENLLPFLAHWVGWELIPGVDADRQRYLIRNAVEIYRWRGTKRGLRYYLHLYSGLPLDNHIPLESQKHISIEEPFGVGLILGQSLLGVDSVLGGGQPFHFVVRLRQQYPNQVDEALVRLIIEQEKPAFCTYDLSIAQPTNPTPAQVAA